MRLSRIRQISAFLLKLRNALKQCGALFCDLTVLISQQSSTESSQSFLQKQATYLGLNDRPHEERYCVVKEKNLPSAQSTTDNGTSRQTNTDIVFYCSYKSRTAENITVSYAKSMTHIWFMLCRHTIAANFEEQPHRNRLLGRRPCRKSILLIIIVFSNQEEISWRID